MADFYINGDNLLKKNLKEIEENLLKTDIMLVKKDEKPTILIEPGNKLFIQNFIKKEKCQDRSRNPKGTKKQATITKSRSVIEDKKLAFSQKVSKTTSESKLQDKKGKERPKQEKDKKLLKTARDEREEKDEKDRKEQKDEKTKCDDKIVDIFTFFDHSNNSSQSSLTEKLSINQSKNEMKYSWQDINSWLSPLQKEEINNKQQATELKKIYSWEILGIGTQTSNCALSNIDAPDCNSKHKCTVKYSWQIIGKSTQASMNDDENRFIQNDDYWQGSILSPRKSYCFRKKNINPKCRESSNQIRILYCERIQTSSDKETATEFTDCRIKYSWENLIEKHEKYKSSELLKSDKIGDNPTNRIECRKYSWENLINQHLN